MSVPKREEIIRELGVASFNGRLGFFVGTGFSMAASREKALSFSRLMQEVATQSNLPNDLEKAPYLLKSLPQIATQIVRELENRGTPRAEAEKQLRASIAEKCNILPHKEERTRFSEALYAASPSWIITTNYDLVLESLMENASTILPNEVLFPSKEQVPIYHLHGHRYSPDTIRVTEEDYVSLLAPVDYQRLKLPLLFRESTTLLLGYSLGDINVRAAMEWSHSFQSGCTAPASGRVIQALYSENPSPQPRIGANCEVIIEVRDIPELLLEIGGEARDLSAWDAYLESDFEQFFSTADPMEIATDGPTRSRFLEIVENAVGDIRSDDFIGFLKRALDPVWARAREDSGFKYYKEFLNILMAVLSKLSFRKANPNVVGFLAEELNRVGDYFDEKERPSTAWHATRLWKSEAPKLDETLLRELKSYANANDLAGLKALVSCSTLAHI